MILPIRVNFTGQYWLFLNDIDSQQWKLKLYCPSCEFLAARIVTGHTWPLSKPNCAKIAPLLASAIATCAVDSILGWAETPALVVLSIDVTFIFGTFVVRTFADWRSAVYWCCCDGQRQLRRRLSDPLSDFLRAAPAQRRPDQSYQISLKCLIKYLWNILSNILEMSYQISYEISL